MSYYDQQDLTDPAQQDGTDSIYGTDPETERAIQQLLQQRQPYFKGGPSPDVAPSPASPEAINVGDPNFSPDNLPQAQPDQGLEPTPWWHNPNSDHPMANTKIGKLLQIIAPLAQGALAGYGPGGVGGGFQRQQQMQRQRQQMQMQLQASGDIHQARQANTQRVQQGMQMVPMMGPTGQPMLQPDGTPIMIPQSALPAMQRASMGEYGKNARAGMSNATRSNIAQQHTESSMAARGLQPDPDNPGSWIPIPREQLSEMVRSRIDLNDAHQEVMDAGKAYKEALTSAVPQKIELAKQRLGLAQQNLGMRVKEYGLHESAFQRDTFGTVGGEAVPGGAVDQSGQPIGSTSPQAKAQARPARGITQNPPQGYARIQTSDGIVHDIPRVNLPGAKQRDPNLKVMVQ